MRVAVLADIHGNLLALNAVLTDLAAAGGADRFWVLGDLASFGPQPEGTLARLTSLPQAHIISGNTDRYLVTNARPSGPLPRNAADWDRLPAVLLEREENFRWTVAQLGYEWFTFLRDLPAQLRFNVPAYGSVLAVHGSPRSDEENIKPETTDAEIKTMLAGTVAQLVVCGHTHFPLDRQVSRCRIINPGSVGMPSRDGDDRAAYALLAFAQGQCTATQCRVADDVDAVIAQVRASGNPAWRWIATQLLGGSKAGPCKARGAGPLTPPRPDATVASRCPREGSMPGNEAIQELEGVWRITCPFAAGSRVMAYFIEAPQPAIIDTGVRSSPRQVIGPALAAAGLDLADTRFILNTHGHWDHMGGNEELRGVASGAQVVAHPAEERFFHDIAAHNRSYRDLVAEVPAFAEMAAAYTGQFADNIGLPAHVDVWLTAGQEIDLGGGIVLQAIHLPGHARGLVGYWWPERRLLFTGDGVQGLGSQVGSFPLVFASAADYRASLERIIELEPSVLCMGHAFLDSEGRQAAVRRGSAATRFVLESLEIAGHVAAVVGAAATATPGRSFEEIARVALAVLRETYPLQLDPATGLHLRALFLLQAIRRELQSP